MTETENSQVDLQEFLLDRFTEEDFVSARSNLLERYTSFHGLLISADGSSILTPDDIKTFKEHAADFTEQTIFSDYENEQLKILTVLIYQMLNSGKGIGPITGKDGKIRFWHDFGHFYILRKVYHHSNKLHSNEITKLIEYQNTLFNLYQRSKQDDIEDLDSTTLQSKDKQFFVISFKNNSFSLVDTAPVQVPVPSAKPEAKPDPAAKPKNYRHVIFCDQDKDSLLETAKSTQLACGVKVAAASYIGVKRKANEDGIVILPDNDQVTVIDGMGGYGNGARARELFCQAVAKNPGNIDYAVIEAQRSYDTQGLGQGGVCAMNMQITGNSEDFNIDLGQAGDVHLVAFDEKFELQYESIDEAIGHKVINAIMGAKVTNKQRRNGWDEFGLLTHNHITAKKGWRVANFSDGIANHFDAATLQKLITNCTPKTAIGRLSSRLNKLMAQEKSYKDNCSIAILDF